MEINFTLTSYKNILFFHVISFAIITYNNFLKNSNTIHLTKTTQSIRCIKRVKKIQNNLVHGRLQSK